MKSLLLFLSISFLLPNLVLATNGGWEATIGKIEDWIRNIAVIGAVLMIVIGGFQWMISAGDPGKIASAKEKVYSAVFGLIIIALATTIAVILGIK